ncbi:MAG: outer membrane beta-barrel protein [Desulfatitalea sp.]|nr:porin family protein [Desulfatitalea sp.]NNK01474.1 outer membrane beta-barrel protein [Desulfatitalea sp.]
MMFTSKRRLAIVCAMITICFWMPSVAGSEGGAIRKADRAETWEFFLPLTYAVDATIKGKGGSSADLNADFGFGFGVGYNFNDHIQLSGLFQWNSRSYDATVVGDDGSTSRYGNTMEISTMALNGTYYFLDGNLTPFLSGMLGYTWVDTNIQNGPPTGYCWYDPWWGYICSYYVPTKIESSMAYGAGLGARYDFNDSFSMQCSYNKSWMDFGNVSGTPDFDIWRLDFIFRMF